MKLPAILPLDANTSCLCQSCLLEKINQTLQRKYAALALNEQLALAKAHSHPPTMIEQLDFYQENEFIVFTRWFHLKRGKCCNSGCRHCPYKKNT